MAQQVRDSWSGAIIFVPTHEEKVQEQNKAELARELKEVRELKAELQELLNKVKD